MSNRKIQSMDQGIRDSSTRVLSGSFSGKIIKMILVAVLHPKRRSSPSWWTKQSAVTRKPRRNKVWLWYRQSISRIPEDRSGPYVPEAESIIFQCINFRVFPLMKYWPSLTLNNILCLFQNHWGTYKSDYLREQPH